MRICNKNISVDILPGSLFSIVFALFIVPLRWVVAWYSAAMVHEVGHILALLFSGEKYTKISFRASGIRIIIPELPPGKGIFCALAGPIIGFLPILLAERFPRLALCALIQSACNLMPVLPLDGGVILRYLILRLPAKIQSSIEISLIVMLVFSSVIVTVYASMGWLPLLFSATLLARYINGKKNLQRLTGKSTIVVPK